MLVSVWFVSLRWQGLEMLVTYKLVGNCGFHIEISYETNIYVGITTTDRRMGNNGKNIPNLED